MKRQKRIEAILILLGISVFFAVIFYTQLLHMTIRLHSDDTGMASNFYDAYYMGKNLKNVINIYSPIALIRYLIFMLFDFSESFVQIKFAVEYFLCLLPALFLGIKYNEKYEWKLLPIFLFFMSIPGEGMEIVTKFHVAPTVAFLFILIIVRYYAEKDKKISVYGFILIMLSLWIAVSEKDILFIIAIICPLMIYKGLLVIKSKKFDKYYAPIVFAFLCGFAFVHFGVSGSTYNGWGARKFAYPEDVIHNIDLGIQGILQMFNIPMLGQNIIQLTTIIFFAKLLLLISSMILVIRNIVQFIKNKQKMDKINVLISLSVVCSIAAYLFSGRQIDLVSVRYIQSLDYLLPILLSRTLAETQFVSDSRWYLVKRINVITLTFLFFLVMAVWPISFEKYEIKEVEKLSAVIENDDALMNGIADYWRGSVFSVLTQGSNMVEAVDFENSEKTVMLFWGEGTEHEHYKSGYEFYNFCIENTAISKEKIQQLYGNPIKMYEEGDTRIYLYDYDVRTIPWRISLKNNQQMLNIGECRINDNNILLAVGQEISISLPKMFIGKFRYVIKLKDNSEYIDMEIVSNENITYNIIGRENNEIICEAYVHENIDDVTLKIANKGDTDVLFEEICIQNLFASEEIQYVDDKIINIPKGKYEVTFVGEDVKKEVVNFIKLNDCNIDIKEIKRGKQRIVFEIQNNENNPVQIKIDADDKMTCYIETPYVDRMK